MLIIGFFIFDKKFVNCKAENKLIKNVCWPNNCDGMACLTRTTNDRQSFLQAGSLRYIFKYTNSKFNKFFIL